MYLEVFAELFVELLVVVLVFADVVKQLHALLHQVLANHLQSSSHRIVIFSVRLIKTKERHWSELMPA